MTTDSLSLLKAIRTIHLRNPENHYERNGTIEQIEAQTAALLPRPEELRTNEKAFLAVCLAARRAWGGCTTPGESLVIDLVTRYADSGLTPQDIEFSAQEFNEDFKYVSAITEKQNIDFPPALHKNSQPVPQSAEPGQ